jgi:hypothetical protein
MTAPSIETVQAWQGRTMVDPAGDKLGTIDAIYLDDETGQPEWATVTRGLFSAKAAFVPLAQAQAMGDSVQVPYDKQQVTDAPSMEADGSLSQDDEAELYRHYGLDYSEHRSDSGLPAGTPDETQNDTVGRDVSGPITDANLEDATSGPAISEEEHEVTLREEEVVVDKRAVPKERVRLDTETVTDERQVSEDLRKEQIEVQGDQDQLRRDQR